jgi:cytochrome c biogenesis protein CcmG/thiol:disulfide interchange protein DsbE
VTKRPYMSILAGVVGAALIGLLVYGISAQSPTRTLDDAIEHGLRPAAPASTIKLPLLSGYGSRSLASYRGKVVVLNFWASWCTQCQEESSVLERAERRLLRRNGTVLGVTFQDTSPDSLEFMKRYRLTYPSLRDPTNELAQAYGTRQVPETFVIDRYGHVVAISRGEIEETFLNQAIALAERV